MALVHPGIDYHEVASKVGDTEWVPGLAIWASEELRAG